MSFYNYFLIYFIAYGIISIVSAAFILISVYFSCASSPAIPARVAPATTVFILGSLYPNSPINETEYIYSYTDSNDWTTRIKLTKPLFIDRSITTRTVHDIREMSDNDDYKSFEDMRFPIIGTID